MDIKIWYNITKAHTPTLKLVFHINKKIRRHCMNAVDREVLSRAMKRLDRMYKDEIEYVDIDLKAAINEEYSMIREALRTVIVGDVASQ